MSKYTYEVKTFLQADASDPNIPKIVNIFYGVSSSNRTTNDMSILESTNYKENLDYDYQFLIDAFSKSNVDDYVIICKKNAISPFDGVKMTDYLEKIFDEMSGNFDVLFLANWMDRCDLYTDIRTVTDGGLKINKTESPNGDLCILFTPSGKRKFLENFDPTTNPIYKNDVKDTNKENSEKINGKTLSYYLNTFAQNGKFMTLTSNPPVVNFDMTTATSNAEYIKGIQCREVPSVKNGGNETQMLKEKVGDIEEGKIVQNDLTWFWLILVILVILLIAYVIYFLTTLNVSNDQTVKTGR